MRAASVTELRLGYSNASRPSAAAKYAARDREDDTVDAGI
jgi:hypothetical protein